MPALRILALHAHPDDAEVLAGGTLALLAARGHSVTVATCTPGDCGSHELGPEEIARVRRAEAVRAASRIGAAYLCLEMPDLAIFVDDPCRRLVTDALRRMRPHIVLAASPIDYHCDHEAASALARGPQSRRRAPERWRPRGRNDNRWAKRRARYADACGAAHRSPGGGRGRRQRWPGRASRDTGRPRRSATPPWPPRPAARGRSPRDRARASRNRPACRWRRSRSGRGQRAWPACRRPGPRHRPERVQSKNAKCGHDDLSQFNLRSLTTVTKSRGDQRSDLRRQEFEGLAGRRALLQGAARAHTVRGSESETHGARRDPEIHRALRPGGARRCGRRRVRGRRPEIPEGDG